MNELLFWLSAKRAGSSQSFRAKVAELGGERADGRLRRITEWNLSKLGHAEFSPTAGDDGWRVAPPVLAAGDRIANCRAVLCGARTPQLMARISDGAGTSRILITPQQWGPDIVEISAAAPDLEALAVGTGIRLQWNASLAILACSIPPKSAVLRSAEMPIGGWTVSRFIKHTLSWADSTRQAALATRSGLFRFRSERGSAYILIECGQAWACDPAIGKYRILKRRNRALIYSAADKLLSIHAACRPPALVERALVLCSGELPKFEGGNISYSRIDAPVAAAVASVLGQRLD